MHSSFFTSTFNISSFSLRTFNHHCPLEKNEKQPWACRMQELLLSRHFTALGHQGPASSQMYFCLPRQPCRPPAQRDSASLTAPQFTQKPPLSWTNFLTCSAWQTLPHPSKPRSNHPLSDIFPDTTLELSGFPLLSSCHTLLKPVLSPTALDCHYLFGSLCPISEM